MSQFQGLTIAAAATALLVAGAARAGDLTSLPDRADSAPLVGVGVICNTHEQAERYIGLRQQGQEISPAVQAVNQLSHDPRGCGLAAIAFLPDKTMGTKSVGGRLVTIVRINVVAGYNGSGWQSVAGAIQYAIVEQAGTEI